MLALGTILAAVAGIAMLVFAIQILVLAFKTSLGWGLASLLLPLAVVVFVVKHWELAKRPFLRALACVPVYVVGFVLIGLGGGMQVTMR